MIQELNNRYHYLEKLTAAASAATDPVLTSTPGQGGLYYVNGPADPGGIDKRCREWITAACEFSAGLEYRLAVYNDLWALDDDEIFPWAKKQVEHLQAAKERLKRFLQDTGWAIESMTEDEIDEAAGDFGKISAINARLAECIYILAVLKEKEQNPDNCPGSPFIKIITGEAYFSIFDDARQKNACDNAPRAL